MRVDDEREDNHKQSRNSQFLVDATRYPTIKTFSVRPIFYTRTGPIYQTLFSHVGAELMNEENRALVRECIDSLGTNINDVSQIFYRELLLKHPELSSVFNGNVEALNTKFFNMLAVLKNVKHLEAISASINDIGRRHFAHYSVKPEYLDWVTSALLTALEKSLGGDFDQKLSSAWISVLDDVSDLFINSSGDFAECENKSLPKTMGGVFENILDDIGGREVIFRIHSKFYAKAFDHPVLGQFFRGKHEDILARNQTDFMVAAFGGENRYKGDTPAFVHMHMFITQEQLILREALLRDCIEAEGLNKRIVDCWLDVDRRFWPGIAKTSVDECVLKCQGQVPIVAKMR